MNSTFPTDDTIAELSAKMLLEIAAVHFRPEEPYKLTSGLASPVYIDCRKLISYPRIRSTLMDFAISKIYKNVGFENIDTVIGGETAGIPFAAMMAEKMGLPMNYVRKKPKGFGRDAQIEGASIEGKKAILVEDLTTDGGSKIKFCEAIRNAGAEVSHAVVVFYYDIFAGAAENFERIGMDLHYLCTWRDVLQVARDNQYFDEKTLSQVEAFLDEPLKWSADHGGASEISK